MDSRLEKLEEYEEKLRQMEADITEMSLEIKKLKLEMKGVSLEDTIEPAPVKKEVLKPAAEKKRFDEPKFTLPELARRVEENREAGSESFTRRIREGKDLEKTIGRSLMGIFASVLIFISLILFATLLLPYFNDTAKMITTYLISGAFLGSGMFLSEKDENNKFYQALTACGIGGIYISLMLSCMYFGVIGQITLYVLLAIWGVGVCLLAKKKQNTLFYTIGELGIFIAVLFGSILCVDKMDTGKFLAIQIFFLLSYLVFYLSHYRKEYADNKIHTISAICNLAVLYFVNVIWFGNTMLCNVLLFAITLVCVGFSFSHDTERQPICFNIFAAIQVSLLMCGFFSLFTKVPIEHQVWIGIAAYLFALLLMVLCEWRAKGNRFPYYAVEGVLLFTMFIAMDASDELMLFGSIPLIVLPCMVYGLLSGNQLLKYGSLFLGFVFSVRIDDYMRADSADVIWWFIIGLAFLVCAYVLQLFKKDSYDMIWKYCLHCYSVFFIANSFYPAMVHVCEVMLDNPHSVLPTEVTFLVFALFNFFMYLSPFRNNLKTGEKEPPYVYWFFNAIAMLIGTILFSVATNPIMHFVLILVSVMLFSMNAVNLLENRDVLWMGAYVGLKFTVLMIFILKSFTDANFVVSIACLLFAIAAIVVGFQGKYKALRVYGLVLSMISTFKFVMIDISYENTLGHAVSFFVAGILCFAISMIYNFIDKKIGNEE